VEDSPAGSPFDHFLDTYGGYLPSTASRWCTRQLKLEPFEKYVGDDPVVSYVGIRGDEDREAYISNKSNIQSIFPFRKNIWSGDVTAYVLKNENIFQLERFYSEYYKNLISKDILNVVKKELSLQFPLKSKLNALLDIDVRIFNQVVIQMLKSSKYPLSNMDDYVLLNNTDILDINDIFKILEDSGIGIPKYYNKIEFEMEGQKGTYARSRSGCYFCFFQQKIEWIWLYEQHPDLFKKATDYEKEGFTWNQGYRLEELILPEQMQKIKKDHLEKLNQLNNKKSDKLLEILNDDNEGCAACFL